VGFTVKLSRDAVTATEHMLLLTWGLVKWFYSFS